MDDQDYYENCWKSGNAPWHRSTIDPFLIDYSSKLDFTPPKRVLQPFCGKCPELKWFYDKGLEVVGVEYIEVPVQEFFKEYNLPYEVRKLPWGKVFETPDKLLKIYVADFYEIDIDEVGKFDLIWDRGVLPTVRVADRERYSKLLKELCNKKFTYILLSLQHEWEADRNPRPTSHEVIQNMYGDWCNIELIVQKDISEKFERLGLDKGYESYHLLTPKL